MVNIFVDDLRNPPTEKFKWFTFQKSEPESWLVFRKMEDALAFLSLPSMSFSGPLVLSLDHDMGLDSCGNHLMTGDKFLSVLEMQICTGTGGYALLSAPEVDIRIHSANPVGRQNMLAAVSAIYRRLQQANPNNFS